MSTTSNRSVDRQMTSDMNQMKDGSRIRIPPDKGATDTLRPRVKGCLRLIQQVDRPGSQSVSVPIRTNARCT